MEKFLEKVAHDLIRKGEGDLSNYIIIVPGKRPRSFFKYLLSKNVEKPVLAPSIYTINEFIERESGLKLLEPVAAITFLYGLYKRKMQNAETIDRFWFFGEMLHADFDDVDKYCADAQHLFSYVRDLKEIEQLFDSEDEEQRELIRRFWSTLYKGTKDKEKNEVRKRFLRFWEILLPLYDEFRDELKKRKFGYEGMLYRMVAEKAKSKKLNFDDKKPVFIGFNALSTSEKDIFEAGKNQNGLFYWDYDLFYVNNRQHEAGFFMRKNLHQFPSAFTSEHHFDHISGQKKIKAIGLPGEIEMAAEVSRQIFEHMKPEDNPLKNGIILGNESLMTPVLQTLPEDISRLNITMGLPLQNTNLYGFVKLLAEMPSKQVLKQGEIFYQSAWVLEILMQPFQLANNDALIEKIRKQNLILIPVNEFGNNEWMNLLFPSEKKNILQYIKNLMFFMADAYSKEEEASLDHLNAEAAVIVYRSLNMLETQLKEQQLALPEPLIHQLINKLLAGLKLTLEGEPLRGTQLMGLIEARTLDFDNLIIAGVNEGCLPSSTVAPSFIPYNLRKAYGLLTFENQDAIFAYYFYRAIQRAENLTFIYNSNDADNDYGEKSRFLQQLEFELDIPIEQISYSHSLEPVSQDNIIIPKHGEVKTKLNAYLDGERQLYPVGLNTFINCPLKFYFRYIAEMKEPEKIEPGVDQRIFGLVFHRTMEHLYLPFVKSKTLIDKVIIESLMVDSTIMTKIRESMRYYFSDIDLHRDDNGMVVLIEQVVLKYVKRVLMNDKADAPFLLLGLENNYEMDFPLNDQRKVKLGGNVDRLQQKDSNILVVDYKTGRTPRSAAKFDHLFAYDEPNRSDAAFQAMLYTRIVADGDFAKNKMLIPSLLYIQEDKPIHALNFAKRKNDGYAELKNEFEEGLRQILVDLFDEAQPFVQTENEEQCSYCPYKVICNR